MNNMHPQSKKRVRSTIMLIIIALLIFCIVFVTLTPYPAAYFLRSLFKKPNMAPPLNYATMEENVVVYSDLEYPSSFPNNTLDVYLPKNTDENTPVVLWIHGGAYVGGDKSDIRYYATALASEGYAVVCMNYALAPEHNYPTPLMQIDDMMNWINSVSDEYSFDISCIILAGDSAGAQLAMQYVIAVNSTAYAAQSGICISPLPYEIKGLLLYCGPYNAQRMANADGVLKFFLQRSAWAYFNTDNWVEEFGYVISVDAHITPFLPPAFITDSNTLSFEAHGIDLVHAFQVNNIYVESYFFSVDFEKTIHEYQFLMDTPAGEECFRRTLYFLEIICNR